MSLSPNAAALLERIVTTKRLVRVGGTALPESQWCFVIYHKKRGESTRVEECGEASRELIARGACGVGKPAKHSIYTCLVPNDGSSYVDEARGRANWRKHREERDACLRYLRQVVSDDSPMPAGGWVMAARKIIEACGE